MRPGQGLAVYQSNLARYEHLHSYLLLHHPTPPLHRKDSSHISHIPQIKKNIKEITTISDICIWLVNKQTSGENQQPPSFATSVESMALVRVSGKSCGLTQNRQRGRDWSTVKCVFFYVIVLGEDPSYTLAPCTAEWWIYTRCLHLLHVALRDRELFQLGFVSHQWGTLA